jgi:SAM-dependent methyltransferase
LGYNQNVKKYAEKIAANVNASYSQLASEFDQTRQAPWPEFDHFLAYTKKGGTVLDLGCGTGRLYDFLKPKKLNYLGIDHNSHLLDLARKNFPEARFRLDDMMDLKLEEGAFDNIFCVAAFHHVPTKKMRKKVIADLRLILREDGVLILTVWNLFQLRYTRAFIKSLFHGAWNDVFISWGNYPLKRYYHAFLPKELLALFSPKEWEIEDFYFTRKGKRVSFLRSFNLVVIARKK